MTMSPRLWQPLLGSWDLVVILKPLPRPREDLKHRSLFWDSIVLEGPAQGDLPRVLRYRTHIRNLITLLTDRMPLGKLHRTPSRTWELPARMGCTE